MEKQYAGEIEKLKGKLKWYAENQELLDQGARKLKARDEEIHKLKMRVEELQTEVSQPFCLFNKLSLGPGLWRFPN